jgi:hypothetical protein
MNRARLTREIACGVLCALCLTVMLPIGILLMLLFSIIDGIARLCRRRLA